MSRILFLAAFLAGTSAACAADPSPPRPPGPPGKPQTGGLRGALAPPAGARIAEGAVAYLEPAGVVPLPPPGRLPIRQHPGPDGHPQFVPPFLIAPKGSTVFFINNDQATHNVTLNFPDGEEPLGSFEPTPEGGEWDAEQVANHTFDAEGPCRVTCRMHDQMKAFIFVAPNPWAAAVRGDGGFAIPGVPPGTYRLRVWHEEFEEAGPPPQLRVAAGQEAEVPPIALKKRSSPVFGGGEEDAEAGGENGGGAEAAEPAGPGAGGTKTQEPKDGGR